MRLIMVASPESNGNAVAEMTFSVGIDTVSRRHIESQHSDGKIRKKRCCKH